MIVFQILFTFFVLYTLIKTVSRYKNKELSVKMFFLWIFFWLVSLVVVLSPSVADLAAYSVGIGRGADLVIYISLALLFFFFFHLLVKIEKINRDITKLTRKISLFEADKK